MNCEICKFQNPKGTVTAIIIKDNKVLLLKRNEGPFINYLDLPGGYMSKDETPVDAIKREIKEELNVDCGATFLRSEPGYAYWKGNKYPVISLFYLVELQGEIKLNNENKDFVWMPIKDLIPEQIAFDTNSKIAKWLKDNFVLDLVRVRELIKQLDSTAEVNEQSLYQAIISGHIEKIYNNGKLVALGTIFPRQTILRCQAVIEDMICDEAYRGKGFGREILRKLLKWAKENGVEMVELTTNPKRIAANELYKSEGFKLHPTNHYLYKVV